MQNFFEDVDASRSKKKVLDSALVLFVEKGFFNTSIPDLVAHSSVSTGSIYHAFKDKEALATELMTLLLDKIDADQSKVLVQYDSPREQYNHMVEWLLQMTLDYPHATQFILYARHREFMPGVPPICSSKPFMMLRSVVEAAQTDGELRQMDIWVASSIAYGGVLRLMQLYLDGMIDTPLMSHREELTEAGWRALKAE